MSHTLALSLGEWLLNLLHGLKVLQVNGVNFEGAVEEEMLENKLELHKRNTVSTFGTRSSRRVAKDDRVQVGIDECFTRNCKWSVQQGHDHHHAFIATLLIVANHTHYPISAVRNFSHFIDVVEL